MEASLFWDAKVKPLEGETIPKPMAADTIVFRDFFLYGLRFLVACFLHQVLEAFEVQLHHLTPNGIVILASFARRACLMARSLMLVLSVSTMSSSASPSESAKIS